MDDFFNSPSRKLLADYLNSPAEKIRRQAEQGISANVANLRAVNTEISLMAQVAREHKLASGVISALRQRDTLNEGLVGMARVALAATKASDVIALGSTASMAKQFADMDTERIANLRAATMVLPDASIFSRMKEWESQASLMSRVIQRGAAYEGLLAQARELALHSGNFANFETDDDEDESNTHALITRLKSEAATPSFYDLFNLFLTILFFSISQLQDPDFTPEDREALVELRDTAAAAAAAAQVEIIERERVHNLERAFVKTHGNIREVPEGGARLLTRLNEGDEVAIERRHGRWLLVTYADSLTNDLRQGWIWRDSLEFQE